MVLNSVMLVIIPISGYDSYILIFLINEDQIELDFVQYSSNVMFVEIECRLKMRLMGHVIEILNENYMLKCSVVC